MALLYGQRHLLHPTTTNCVFSKKEDIHDEGIVMLSTLNTEQLTSLLQNTLQQEVNLIARFAEKGMDGGKLAGMEMDKLEEEYDEYRTMKTVRPRDIVRFYYYLLSILLVTISYNNHTAM